MIQLRQYLILCLPLSLILAGCPVKDQLKDKLKPTSNDELLNQKKTITESIEVSISCNKDTIQDYIDKGWKIVNTSTSEVPCSWKSVKATKNCNLERDKGCKITVPDLIGEKTTYTLEKQSIVKVENSSLEKEPNLDQNEKSDQNDPSN